MQQQYPTKRASILANAYLVVSDSGVIRPEGVKLLRELWRLLDPNFTLISQVTAEINLFYVEKRHWLQNQFRIGPVNFEWLANLMCWEFVIEPIDLRHSLHVFDPPPEKRVKALGLDIGEVIASIVPLGGGGTTRARFQLVALTNKLGKHRSLFEIIYYEILSLEFLKDFQRHVFRSATLYLTMIACRYVQIILKSLTFVRILRQLWDIVQYATGARGLCHRRRMCAQLFKILLMRQISVLLGAYRSVMEPRAAMLVVRLHRRLVQEGLLCQGDFQGYHQQHCLNTC